MPYASGPGWELHHGDCREILPNFPAASADLILADPPYGQSWESNRRKRSFGPIVGDESMDVGLGGIGASVRVLRLRRHLYVFGRWVLPSDLMLSEPVELIWDKVCTGSGNLGIPWGPQHEPIQFFVYQGDPAHRRDGTGRLSARLRRGSILRYRRPSGTEVAHHPTEKPTGLLRELIESSSCLGETVLDPFTGSGSSLLAALLEGRRAIGIEIEERYCEIAARRLSAALPEALAA